MDHLSHEDMSIPKIFLEGYDVSSIQLKGV